MGSALPLIALAGGAALLLVSSKSSAKPSSGRYSITGLQQGGRYKLVARSSSAKQDTNAMMAQAQAQIGPQGFSIDTITFDDNGDPYVYDLTGTYKGTTGGLSDGGGMLLISSSLIAAPVGPQPSPQPSPPNPGPIPGPGPNPKYDANLPQAAEAAVDAELANETDPNELLRFADALDTAGYPIAAAALRKRAAELQQPVPPPAPNPNPMPPPQPQPPPAPPSPNPQPNPGPNPPPPPPLPAPNPPQDNVMPWDSSTMQFPDVSNVAIPGSWKRASQETRDIQAALNAWADAVGYPGSETPLVVDGLYGHKTQSVAAAFQSWAMVADGFNDVVDGLVGPITQPYLVPFLPGGGAFSTDGGY